MHEKLLNNKISNAKTELSFSEKSVQYWLAEEKKLKEKYGQFPSETQCRHIRAIKGYRKQAEAKLKYWSNELSNLEHKILLYNVFS